MEHYRAPAPNKRTRLDPLDPGTAMHLGAREFRETTDPAVLQVVLRVRDGANASYSWVTCGSCDSGWPVPVYAEAG